MNLCGIEGFSHEGQKGNVLSRRRRCVFEASFVRATCCASVTQTSVIKCWQLAVITDGCCDSCSHRVRAETGRSFSVSLSFLINCQRNQLKLMNIRLIIVPEIITKPFNSALPVSHLLWLIWQRCNGAKMKISGNKLMCSSQHEAPLPLLRPMAFR